MRMRKTILLVSFLILILVFLTACGSPREPMDINVFRTVMESEGYTIADMMYESDEFDDNIFSYYLSVFDDDYSFEFAVFTSEQYAINTFNGMRAQAEANRGSTCSYRTVNVSNHSMFEQTSDGMFWHIYRVDNTLLYVLADSDYRNHVRELIDRIQ